ncbi:acyl-CoA dehydrogenase family protein [Dactylosporangium sp. NPDC048998]|uniref:acyl-CoA dehydrogenase family protein n=1 Tax=Dactylosporangium sp. NPDC048998 TaxID=3363976 RepID=UPI003720CC0B
MAWEFETDPEFQEELDWADRFVRERVEPLDYLLKNPHDLAQPRFDELVRPLQAQVKARGLWACHLDPEHGGKGYGQVKLALLAELTGRARFGPTVFGAQAPDTGNSEILARFGTPEQRARYLEPLLDNRIVSCFAMTEPHGGSDPTALRTTATLDGDNWVVVGDKWFSTSAKYAAFFIVAAVTDPDASPHRRMSLVIVPAGTPGVRILRDSGFHGEPEPAHSHVRFDRVRVPAGSLLGERGAGFAVAQARLGGGRMHHAMRTVGQARRAFEMMCERAVSRTTKGERLADKQLVQAMVADAWTQLRMFRLLVLETAWLIDARREPAEVRRNIAAVKATMPRVLHDVASAALQVHGSLGLSTDMPFSDWIMQSYRVGLSDGPTDVHRINLAKQLLRDVTPGPEDFPEYFRPFAHERAVRQYPVGVAS